MTKTIHAISENSVFRPVEPVNLLERCDVDVEVRQVKQELKKPPMGEGLAKIYVILGERYGSGHPDTTARHNEHQP